MEFKTKFNIGNEVWFIQRLTLSTQDGNFVDYVDIVCGGEIYSINVAIFGFSEESEGKHEQYGIVINSVPEEYRFYAFNHKVEVAEEWVFNTKEEAEKYLRDSEDLKK